MTSIRFCENSFFVFVKCIDEFKDNKEFIKYCFLMQNYRHMHKRDITESNLDLEQQKTSKEVSIDLNRQDDLYSPFSIESNVVLKKTCRLVENQEYLDIRFSEFDTPNSLDISSKHIQLLDTINGKRTILF